MRTWLLPVALVGIVATLAGCAAVRPGPRAGFDEVDAIVRDRIDRRVSAVPPEEGLVASAVRELLADGLTMEEAVDVALVNNRELRAAWAGLGVAHADVVEASLLHNPVLDAAVGIPVGGGAVDLGFGVALDVVDFLYVPLRKRVADAAFEEAKLEVAARVLDHAWQARTAFLRHQADMQMIGMRRRIAEATGASFEVSRRLRDAGNITERDLLAERALAEEARLALRRAEVRSRESREELNAVLGLWGDHTAWSLATDRLPDPPRDASASDLAGLEPRVVERSLDLAMAEKRVVGAGERLGLDRASALFPEVLVGGEVEREGEWEAGPTFSLPIPIFDRGQGRIERARAELARARELHHDLAVRLRAAARATRDRVVGHEEIARYHRDTLLPLHDHLVRETGLHYNAMQLGPVELLRAKESQIRTGASYVEALRDFWLARADLDLLLAGRIPPTVGLAEPAPAADAPVRFPFPALH